MALKDKFIIRLTVEQRQELEKLATTGTHPAATLTRARILLKADVDADGWTDDCLAERSSCKEVWRRLCSGNALAAVRTASSTARPRRG